MTGLLNILHEITAAEAMLTALVSIASLITTVAGWIIWYVRQKRKKRREYNLKMLEKKRLEQEIESARKKEINEVEANWAKRLDHLNKFLTIVEQNHDLLRRRFDQVIEDHKNERKRDYNQIQRLRKKVNTLEQTVKEQDAYIKKMKS